MANSIKIKVNGLTHGVSASLDTPLLYVLHNELHLHGPRFGCGLAQCGACSVLLDGKEIRSCVTPVAAVSGKSITTLEGPAGPVGGAARHDGGGAGAASVAAGVDRRAGAALRLLPERDDDPGRRPPRDDEEPVRGPDPHGDERASLPLRDLSENPDRDPEGRGSDGKGRCVMTGLDPREGKFSTAGFTPFVVKAGGALIVGFSTLGATFGAKLGDRATGTFDSNGPYDSQQIDSWLAVHADNTVSMKLGMVELGQGSTTGLLMIAAEELNCDMSQMRMIANDTDVTPNQGGTSGSQAVHVGGKQTRAAAAAAHQALLGAGRRPSSAFRPASLTVSKGVVSGGGKTGHLRTADRRQALQRRDSGELQPRPGAVVLRRSAERGPRPRPGCAGHEAVEPVHARRHQPRARRGSTSRRR